MCLLHVAAAGCLILTALVVATGEHVHHTRRELTVEHVSELSSHSQSTARAVHRVYDQESGLYCDLVGDCHACPMTEKDESYCRETGHRQELLCEQTNTDNGTNAPDEHKQRKIKFKSCSPVLRANKFHQVLMFEVVMAVMLSLAYMALVKERRKHMSSFDLRKDPRQRASLLGSSPKADD
ncbi:TPA: hypothetical protein N0F65_009535 [Lagenidium giganteum]|uniref:Uncharacterized protein n=1 Tax=Lagenidium giganteum TaxID=4803 RepID=A0AAV2YWZ7_9STRA|nr:TPA: hypothetical protein N0F65_009535 [Lagenidium giganteum]